MNMSMHPRQTTYNVRRVESNYVGKVSDELVRSTSSTTAAWGSTIGRLRQPSDPHHCRLSFCVRCNGGSYKSRLPRRNIERCFCAVRPDLSNTPRVGSDPKIAHGLAKNEFLSRSPCGERRIPHKAKLTREFVSIHAPPCGERQELCPHHLLLLRVSIHAPRVGSDQAICTDWERLILFLSTLPRVERRLRRELWPVEWAFLSTLPVWGATRLIHRPHLAQGVSIHAPRVGSDDLSFGAQFAGVVFLSTLPVWGATTSAAMPSSLRTCFYPRSPCGERPPRTKGNVQRKRFLSTLPVWGATPLKDGTVIIFKFLSTLPVWGATAGHLSTRQTQCCFYPRSPCGERHHQYVL